MSGVVDGQPRRPGAPEPLCAGEPVLLLDRKGRRYLITLQAGAAFHFHAGEVSHDALIGAAEGTRVRSGKGAELTALRPTPVDWTLKAPRGAQVMYPKDQALVVMLADICPGATVVEAGAGSGALSAALLRAVGTEGRVISFEARDEHADVAERNVERRLGGPPANWELRRADVTSELAELDCERVVLDLLEPWAAVPAAVEALRPGGFLAAYTPSVPQVMRLREQLDEDPRWGLAETLESLVRGWHVEGLAVRPDHRMVAHTGFLTVVRRLAGTPSA